MELCQCVEESPRRPFHLRWIDFSEGDAKTIAGGAESLAQKENSAERLAKPG